jgi:C-terminal processing protease CtpA/Prc
MLNMDMIGRMDPESNIVINGSGTSQVWSKLLTVKNCYPIQATLRPSGVGPSDHTSFYNASIPVLHFFTGTHEDYHKPTDTPEKLNYEGIELITRYIQTLVLQTDELGKLDYQQTDTDQSAGGSRMNFSVTLGVIPDYVFGGPGMRLDGVTKGKPAEKAGLKTGDVLLQIGKHRIADIQSYMQALGTFKKGQQVNATYLRDGKERTTEITF